MNDYPHWSFGYLDLHSEALSKVADHYRGIIDQAIENPDVVPGSKLLVCLQILEKLDAAIASCVDEEGHCAEKAARAKSFRR